VDDSKNRSVPSRSFFIEVVNSKSDRADERVDGVNNMPRGCMRYDVTRAMTSRAHAHALAQETARLSVENAENFRAENVGYYIARFIVTNENQSVHRDLHRVDNCDLYANAENHWD
jgi:hypothetical protein